MAEVMEVSLKTENRRSRCPVSRFRQWLRRAEGHGGTAVDDHAWRCR
jgi:hypothetical protein